MRAALLSLPLMLPLALQASPFENSNKSRGDKLTRQPYAMLAADYIPMDDGDLWGITLAPTHYDPHYPEWGYYGGFAWGGSSHAPWPEPGRAKTRRYMVRFGVSRRLVSDLNLYGGVVRLTDELRYTNMVTPRHVGAEPIWHTENEHHWGGEIGLRYMLPFNLAVGLGYNSATESMVFTLGVH
ncbi:TonB-dependent receptor [Ferrimonas gelatinilytica]|uniref:Outer membrane protein beta-barrel domain-containing protein n=1 Tax=Ferrimonas gelatinilytica TaxID=1255257 RepID=A0ABP9S9U0_9GAMM